ncbi:MAG TPA: hypothetical protein VGR70_21235, partial [Stellaceae bacterium]|nr:hypothetical protein [Stellaceae bacterium]
MKADDLRLGLEQQRNMIGADIADFGLGFGHRAEAERVVAGLEVRAHCVDRFRRAGGIGPDR